MILIVDMNARKDSLAKTEFVESIGSAVGAHEIRHYMERFDPNAYSRVILSGTPLKDSAYMENLGRLEWLRTFKKPVLGICAGMQAIASVYGSKVERRQEIGMVEVETTEANPLFSGKFMAYSLHNLSVKPSDEFDVLAKSANCVQAIKHRDKPLYGVLFHPEVRNRDILEKFARI